MTRRSCDIRIGTSGWHYDHWVRRFYPEKMPNVRAIYAYFNNDVSGHALNNARTLKQILGVA